MGQHCAPRGPIVRHIVTPEIDMMRNGLGGEYVGKLHRTLRRFVVTLTGEKIDVVLRAKFGENTLVIQVGEIIHGTVEVTIVVIVAVGVRFDIIRAAHGNRAIEHIRSPEQRVGCMQRAQTCTGRDDGGVIARHISDERHDLINDILVVLLMPHGAVRRRNVLIQPALAVDAVDGERFDLSRVNERLDGIDEIESLVLEVVGGRRGEHQQRQTVMAIDGNFHLLVQVGAVPGMNLALHTFLGENARMGKMRGAGFENLREIIHKRILKSKQTGRTRPPVLWKSVFSQLK